MIFKKIINWLKKKYNDCFFVGSTDALPPPLKKDEEMKKKIGFKIKNILCYFHQKKEKLKYYFI